MAQTSGKVLVQWMVAALFIALLGGAQAAQPALVCNLDISKLELCRAAITGKKPPPPTKECCDVIKPANLPCLCSFKSVLPAYKIDSKNAMALPRKCGMRLPRAC